MTLYYCVVFAETDGKGLWPTYRKCVTLMTLRREMVEFKGSREQKEDQGQHVACFNSYSAGIF